MDLGIFRDQKKCPKWKTCLYYGGSDGIKFGTFAGLWCIENRQQTIDISHTSE